MTMAKLESWRKTILDAVLEEGELSADTLHEGAEGGEELVDAEAAAQALVDEGLLAEDHDVWTVAPGMEAACREAALTA